MKLKSGEENFWDNPQKAGEILKKIEKIKKEKHEWKNIKTQLNTLIEFVQELKTEAGEDIEFICDSYKQLKKRIKPFEIKSYFNGKYDDKDAVMIITAGAGGTDAQDWAQMLLRMYLKYFEKKGFEVKILNENPSPEAGLKNVSLKISGEMAYGHLRSEKGVHRLVRQSPFNADNLRQTSFALLETIPIIADAKLNIGEKDLKIETFRSSGAGGQHVNTTDSAVRIKHLPTGITATCQGERSQLQNRRQAMKVLESKLFQQLERQKKDKQAALKGEHKSAEWGSQIRSYVLHPYKMVKDHRTGHQESDAEKVLDGNIENFIKDYLSSTST